MQFGLHYGIHQYMLFQEKIHTFKEENTWEQSILLMHIRIDHFVQYINIQSVLKSLF